MDVSLPLLLGCCHLTIRTRQAKGCAPASSRAKPLRCPCSLTLQGSPSAAAGNGRERCYLGWVGEVLEKLDVKASEWKFWVGLPRGVVPPADSLVPLFFGLPSLPVTFLGFPLTSGPSLALAEEDNGAFLAFAVLFSDLVPPAGQLSLCCPKASMH